jgi:hypothetical protein
MAATPTTQISQLASGIIEYSLGGSTELAPFLYVSGWLDTNIGRLNNSIYSSFYTESGLFMPSGLMPEEASIYSSLFVQGYYKKVAQSVLLNVTSSAASDFSMIKEGDSVVQRTSRQQIARSYNEMAAAEKEECDRLIYQYQINAAAPSQVAGEDGDDYFYYSPNVTV